MRVLMGDAVLEGFEAGWRLSRRRESGTFRDEGYPSGAVRGLSAGGCPEAAEEVFRARSAVAAAGLGREGELLAGRYGRVRFESVSPSDGEVPPYYAVQVQGDDVEVTERMLRGSEALGHAMDHEVGTVLEGKWKTRRYPASLTATLLFCLDENVRLRDAELPAGDFAALYRSEAVQVLRMAGMSEAGAGSLLAAAADLRLPEGGTEPEEYEDDTEDEDGPEGEDAPEGPYAGLLDPSREPLELRKGLRVARGTDGDLFLCGDLSAVRGGEGGGKDEVERLSAAGLAWLRESFGYVPGVEELVREVAGGA